MAFLVSPDFQQLTDEDGQPLICDEPATIVEKLSLGFANTPVPLEQSHEARPLPLAIGWPPPPMMPAAASPRTRLTPK